MEETGRCFFRRECCEELIRISHFVFLVKTPFRYRCCCCVGLTYCWFEGQVKAAAWGELVVSRMGRLYVNPVPSHHSSLIPSSLTPTLTRSRPLRSSSRRTHSPTLPPYQHCCETLSITLFFSVFGFSCSQLRYLGYAVGHPPSVLRPDLRLTQLNDRREGKFAGLFFFLSFFIFFFFFLFPSGTTHVPRKARMARRKQGKEKKKKKKKEKERVKDGGGRKRERVDPVFACLVADGE